MDYGFGGAGADNDNFVDDGENPNLSQVDQFAPALGANGNTANTPRASPTNFITATNTPTASAANAAATAIAIMGHTPSNRPPATSSTFASHLQGMHTGRSNRTADNDNDFSFKNVMSMMVMQQ